MFLSKNKEFDLCLKWSEKIFWTKFQIILHFPPDITKYDWERYNLLCDFGTTLCKLCLVRPYCLLLLDTAIWNANTHTQKQSFLHLNTQQLASNWNWIRLRSGKLTGNLCRWFDSINLNAVIIIIYTPQCVCVYACKWVTITCHIWWFPTTLPRQSAFSV